MTLCSTGTKVLRCVEITSFSCPSQRLTSELVVNLHSRDGRGVVQQLESREQDVTLGNVMLSNVRNGKTRIRLYMYKFFAVLNRARTNRNTVNTDMLIIVIK